jgi:hypothetical protein
LNSIISTLGPTVWDWIQIFCSTPRSGGSVRNLEADIVALLRFGRLLGMWTTLSIL